jgi:transcriptional regulator with XRE-family HTH domain
VAGVKRTAARIAGASLVADAARAAGLDVVASRKRRRLTQRSLGQRAGVSRSLISAIERGLGANVSLETWLAIGEALDRPFRAGFARDGLVQPEHAAHLDIQELVLRAGRGGGWDGRFELATRPADPARSSDAPLLDRRGRRMILNECWNTFGDLGAAARSSDRKVAEARHLAIAIAGDGEPYEVGLCWIVRDTRANRALIDRYRHIFASRFPGSSAAWVRTITEGGPVPDEPGLVWCDVRATRIYARRRPRG